MSADDDRVVEYLDDLDHEPGMVEITCPTCGDVDAVICSECQGMGTVLVPAVDLG